MRTASGNNLSVQKSPCKIQFISFSDGVKSTYEYDGEYIYTAEETQIFYSQDASFVTVQIKEDGSVSMSRKGDCFLEFVFVKNSLTRGTIGLSNEEKENAKGTVPLFTEDIKIISDKNGAVLSIYLKYSLRFECEEQKFVVRMLITAK